MPDDTNTPSTPDAPLDPSAPAATAAPTPTPLKASILSGVVSPIESLLNRSLADFKTSNGAAVQQLGPDVVNAIWGSQVATFFPALAALPASPSAQDIAARSDQETARDKMFAVVAQAEAEHYAAVHTLKLNAISEISKIMTGILAIVGGFAVKYVSSVTSVAS